MQQKMEPRLADAAMKSRYVDYASFEKYVNASPSSIYDHKGDDGPSFERMAGRHDPDDRQFSLLRRLNSKQFDAIRGQIARPGMSPTISSKGKLTNDEGEFKEEFEEFRTDKIPIKTYRKMSQDPALKEGTLLLTGLVSSLKWTIRCREERIEKLITQVYKRHHNNIIRNCIAVGGREGYVFAEKVYQREQVSVYGRDDEVLYEGPAVGLNFLNWIDPEESPSLKYFKSRSTGDIAYVSQRVFGKSNRVQVKRKNLFWFAMDKEFNGVFGNARYKSAYPFWYYDKINYQYALNTLEKSGAPHLEGRHPLGSTTVGSTTMANDEVMANVLVDLSRDGLVILPSVRDDNGEFLWQVEYKEPSNDGVDAFLNFSSYNEKKKWQALGIPESVLSSEVSNSETDAKIDLLLVIVEDLVDQIQNTIQADIIDYLVSYNFGEEYKSLVDFKIDRSGLGRRKILKEIVVNMLRAQTSMKNYTGTTWVDLEKAMEEMGVPTASFDRAFFENKGAGDESGENMIDEAQRDEDSNGIDRVSPDDRDRDRESKRDDSVKD